MKARGITCPQCHASDIADISYNRVYLCIFLVIMAIVASKGLRFAGNTEAALHPEKYASLLSLNELHGKAPMTFPYDQVVYPDCFKWSFGIQLLNLLLILYAFRLIGNRINGNKKCNLCNHTFHCGDEI